MLRRTVLAGVMALGLIGPVVGARAAEDGAKAEKLSASDMAKLADELAPSFVRVEYTVQYDKGEAPEVDYTAWRMVYMRNPMGSSFENWPELIKDERPAERAGYVLSDRRIITSDPMIHPRFIKSISVRFGDQVVKAKPVEYARTQDAWVLELEEPLKGVKPLVFDSSKKGPYLWGVYQLMDDKWGVGVGSNGAEMTVVEGNRRVVPVSGEGLAIDQHGAAVGLTFGGELPVDGSWKGSPETWAKISEAEMQSMMAKLESASSGGIVRVALTFRSPRNTGNANPYARYMREEQDQESSMTEWHGSGLLVDDKTVVVLANLKPKVTARLKEIRVFSSNTGPKGVEAKFGGTAADYGCFLATLDAPLSGAVEFAPEPITDFRQQLLLKDEVTVAGETRTAYGWRDRISGFTLGWHRQVYPVIGSSGAGYYGRYSGRGSGQGEAGNFYFTTDGKLVAVPIAKREKVAVESRWDSGSGASVMSVAYLAEVLKDREHRMDAQNRPLSEDEENRLAWLGVELQAMNADLARVNKVVDETSGGTTGGIVTYVYENSPAAKAGLEVGDIVLRLRVKGQPKPLDVQLESSGMGGMMDQMWAHMDQIPEEYLEQLPQPWGSVENSLTRSLTDIGFGTPFTAEIFRDGKVVKKDMVIEEGPAYYGSAKHFKSEAAGITVHDLTYEVRRYFQLSPDAPGVIISKIEKGSKAAVAGLKPYELILSVNDAPIKSSAELEKAIAAGGEFRLSIKRMTVGRIVKIKVDAAKKKDAESTASVEKKKAGMP